MLLICPHGRMRAEFQEVFGRIDGVSICHAMEEYPPAVVTARLIRIHAPEAAVLSFEHPDLAAAVLRQLKHEVHGLPVMGIHPTGEASVLMQALRAGARDFLSMPFDPEALAEAVQRIRVWLNETPPVYAGTKHIYSFLPAKAGVGATTLAMNISAAVARRREVRVLLVDLDLACGMIRFLLNLPAGSIMDAIQRSPDMDLELWRQTVVPRDGVDVLHSGGLSPQAYLDPAHVQGMIDFARRDYGFMCFDLSGNMEQYSLHVMNESKEVFLVSTPEECTLRLAREKLAWLQSAGLRDRVSVLLNRHDRGGAVPADQTAQRIVGIPVRALFGNHYKLVERAVLAGGWVEPHSRLGRQCAEFAARLLTSAAVQPSEPNPEVSPVTLANVRARRAVRSQLIEQV
jgi:pilus assembly protein CpaE